MLYRPDLRQPFSNLLHELSSHENLKVFKDKPNLRATIFQVLKNCLGVKEQGNKKKSDLVHQN